jgi:hypothetical protein
VVRVELSKQGRGGTETETKGNTEDGAIVCAVNLVRHAHSL